MLINVKDLWIGQTVWDVVFGECFVVRTFSASEEFDAQILNCGLATTLRYNKHGHITDISDNTGDSYEIPMPDYRSLYFNKPIVNGDVVQPPKKFEQKFKKGDRLMVQGKDIFHIEVVEETASAVVGYGVDRSGAVNAQRMTFEKQYFTFSKVEYVKD